MKIPKAEGFENEKRDCTVRALSFVTNIPYPLVYEVMRKYGRRKNCGFRVQDYIQKICKEMGFTATQVKRSGSLYRFLREHPTGRYYCINGGHCFVVIDGVSHDEDKMWCQIKGAWLIEKEKEIEEVNENGLCNINKC